MDKFSDYNVTCLNFQCFCLVGVNNSKEFCFAYLKDERDYLLKQNKYQITTYISLLCICFVIGSFLKLRIYHYFCKSGWSALQERPINIFVLLDHIPSHLGYSFIIFSIINVFLNFYEVSDGFCWFLYTLRVLCAGISIMCHFCIALYRVIYIKISVEWKHWVKDSRLLFIFLLLSFALLLTVSFLISMDSTSKRTPYNVCKGYSVEFIQILNAYNGVREASQHVLTFKLLNCLIIF